MARSRRKKGNSVSIIGVFEDVAFTLVLVLLAVLVALTSLAAKEIKPPREDKAAPRNAPLPRVRHRIRFLINNQTQVTLHYNAKIIHTYNAKATLAKDFETQLDAHLRQLLANAQDPREVRVELVADVKSYSGTIYYIQRLLARLHQTQAIPNPVFYLRPSTAP